MNTPIWFPALRALLERKLGPYLPPHPFRLLMGSALAALLAAGLTGAGYLTFHAVAATWQGVQAITTSVGNTLAELAAPPSPKTPEAISGPPADLESTSTDNLPSARPGRQPGRQPNTQPGTQASLQVGPAPSTTQETTTPTANTPLPASASLAPPAPYPVLNDPLVVREPIVPDALPYAERTDLSLADSAKQVDFALMQTFARLGLDRSRLDVLHIEQKQTAGGSLFLQRIRIYMSGTEADFIQSLNDTLQAWADNATLHVQRKGEWLNATTHPEVLASFNPVLAGPKPAGREHDTPKSSEPLGAQGATTNQQVARVELFTPMVGPLVRVTVGGEISHEVFFTPVGAVFVPPPPDTEPRLTIVIDDLGANMDAVHKLLDLDLPITFSIIPHLQHAKSTALAAHKAGQEVLVHQPMEPMQAPYVKTGPGALLLGMNTQTMHTIMNANIAKVPYATGVNNHMGSRLTSNAQASRVVCSIAAPAGLFVLDSLTHTSSVFFDTARSQNLMAFRRDFFLDDGVTSVRSVRNILENAERTAKRTGHAIVIGHPKAETLAALKAWSQERDASVAVVPLRYQTVK